MLGDCLYSLLMALSKREVTFQLHKDWLILFQLLWSLLYQWENTRENGTQRSCSNFVQEKLWHIIHLWWICYRAIFSLVTPYTQPPLFRDFFSLHSWVANLKATAQCCEKPKLKLKSVWTWIDGLGVSHAGNRNSVPSCWNCVTWVAFRARSLAD